MPERYNSARPITPGTRVPPANGVIVACSAEGRVALMLQDGSLIKMYLLPGTFQFDGIAVVDVNAAGTTATVDVAALY